MRKKYHTIKELIIDVYQKDGLSDYEYATQEVKKYFPNSKWKKSHFSWYRSQFKKGKIEISGGKPATKTYTQKTDSQVKTIGDEILNHINFVLDITAKNDTDLRFKLNRWVYARLLQAEIRAKRPIKKQLWDTGMKSCQGNGCNKKFTSLKNVEIHRRDNSKGYSIVNCILVCRECHEKNNT